MGFLGNAEKTTSESEAFVSASAFPEMGNSTFYRLREELAEPSAYGTAVSEPIGPFAYTRGVKQHDKRKRKH
jgi:hypothetical protein